MADRPTAGLRSQRRPLGPFVHRIIGDFVEFKERAAVMGFAHEHEFTEQHFFEQVVDHCGGFLNAG